MGGTQVAYQEAERAKSVPERAEHHKEQPSPLPRVIPGRRGVHQLPGHCEWHLQWVWKLEDPEAIAYQ